MTFTRVVDHYDSRKTQWALRTETETELTMSDKIMLCNDPIVKDILMQQEAEEKKPGHLDIQMFTDIMQKESELVVKECGKKGLRYKLFFHKLNEYPAKIEDGTNWALLVRDGVEVHLHYYITTAYAIKQQPHFWRTFKFDIVPMIEKLQRSSALVVRSKWVTLRDSLVPSWRKIMIESEEVQFNLIPDHQIVDEKIIILKKKHRKTGITVIVEGPEKEYQSLERKALVMLSQQVREFEYLKEKKERASV